MEPMPHPPRPQGLDMPSAPNLVGQLAHPRVGLPPAWGGDYSVAVARRLGDQRAVSPANIAEAIVGAWREVVSPNGILDAELPDTVRRTVMGITDSATVQAHVLMLVPAAAQQSLRAQLRDVLEAALAAEETPLGAPVRDGRDVLLDSLWSHGGVRAHDAALRVDPPVRGDRPRDVGGDEREGM
jgi:hypothetical protein